MNHSDNAVVLHDISLAYEGRPVVHRLSGVFDRGSLTAIIGPNGAGKSSLLKGIVGLLRPVRGVIRRPQRSNATIAYLPQHAEIERRFPISVIDTVLIGLWRRIGWMQAVNRRLRKTAELALETVGLEGFERKRIETLSAGQFQRLLFARLIVQDAELILLDEPFNAIDWRSTEDLLRIVAEWHRDGRTVIAVLHDLDQVRAYFPETLLIARECIAWGPTRESLMPQNLRRARELSESWWAETEHRGRVPA